MKKEDTSTGLDYEYNTLMNMTHVSVSKHLLDDHFTLKWGNDFYYELIGYGREEYEALYHNQCDRYYINEELGIHDEELWAKIGETVIAAMESGKDGYTSISHMRQKNGEYIWIRMSGTFTQEYMDGYQVSYTVMTDISDIMQMKAEQSVTYDNLPGFVAKYRVEEGFHLVLLDANKRFVEFFGEECWKNNGNDLFLQNFRRNEAVFNEQEEKMKAGRPVHFTLRVKGHSGKEAWLQVNADCMDWQGGAPVYLAIFIDMTNEIELRTALEVEQEANKAKSDFLSRMSHDIRTPMNAIIGMTDIATAHADDSEKLHDCLKKISLSSQHLLGLINDVLDMSKIESGKMTLHNDTMSLPELLENVVAIMQPQFKEKKQNFSIRLRYVHHENFCGDALRLRQVFLNILSNAGKFTPKGGSITMDVQEHESEDPEIAQLSFVFTDTGKGMQPEFLEHIFDAFSREQDSRIDKTEGTGLGMAITQKIVELLGGTIEVESEPEKGSTFSINLPLKIEEMMPVSEQFPDLKVLIADDDAIMCEYMAEMLETLSIHAEWVDNGAMVIEKVEAAHKEDKDYDVVILDWKMPVQDGVQTTRRIRQICGDSLPILIISAYDWNDIEKEAKDAGVSEFLPKPVFTSTLCRGLQKCIQTQQPKEKSTEEDHNYDFIFHGKQFLLAEDNTLNREVAVELLSYNGVAVDVACDGAQCVEMFKQSPEGFYDVVLMDVQMPVMDGYVATKEIRSLDRKDAQSVPILALTADVFAEDISTGKEVGMNGHLAKPLDEKTLKKEIAKYLGNRQ